MFVVLWLKWNAQYVKQSFFSQNEIYLSKITLVVQEGVAELNLIGNKIKVVGSIPTWSTRGSQTIISFIFKPKALWREPS